MIKKLVAISIWHAIQIIFGLFILGMTNSIAMITHLFIGVVIAILNYLLFKKNRIAYFLILIFLFLQSLSFNFPWFQWQFNYGVMLDIHIYNSPIGFNPVTLMLFFLLLSIRKNYTNQQLTNHYTTDRKGPAIET